MCLILRNYFLEFALFWDRQQLDIYEHIYSILYGIFHQLKLRNQRKLNIEDLVRVLLCSDGLTNMVSDLEIMSILSDKSSVEETATRLVQTANENGGKDNISVIVIDFTGEVSDQNA